MLHSPHNHPFFSGVLRAPLLAWCEAFLTWGGDEEELFSGCLNSLARYVSRLLDDVASSDPGPAEFCSVLQDMRHVCLLGHWVVRRILSHTWRGPECEVRDQQDCFLLEALRRSPLLPLLNWRLSLFMGLYAHHLDFCLPRYRVCVCVVRMSVSVCQDQTNTEMDFPCGKQAH